MNAGKESRVIDMAENQETVFRKKTLERINSPEHLTEYLHVTNPGIWAVLAAVILLLAGILAWAAIGTLETTLEATVVVEEHTAKIVPAGAESLSAGMPLRIAGQEFMIDAAETDEYGRTTGTADVALPDGTYNGVVVVERTHPIDFLLTSR